MVKSAFFAKTNKKYFACLFFGFWGSSKPKSEFEEYFAHPYTCCEKAVAFPSWYPEKRYIWITEMNKKNTTKSF